MTYRVKQVLFRTAMRVMAGNTGIRPRFDPVMGIDKIRRLRVVALRANFAAGDQGHGSVVRTVRTMAGGAILAGGLVNCAVTPVLGHFTVTPKTQRRLVLDLEVGMGRTMATVTGHTLLLHHRFMLELEPGCLRFNVRMAFQTNLPGPALDQLVLVSAVRCMAGVAIAFGKREMRRLCRLLNDQPLMTGQAEFALIRCHLQQPGLVPAMGIVATRAFPTGKRTVLPEEAFLRLGLPVAGETEIRLLLRQQHAILRVMRGMTFEAEPLLGRNMRFRGGGIGLFSVTFETELRRFAFQQCITIRGMAVVAGQTFTFSRRLMCAADSRFVLPMIMAIQADFGRRLGEHPHIFTGMLGVTRLALPRLDRLVLGSSWHIVMTGQTEPVGE